MELQKLGQRAVRAASACAVLFGLMAAGQNALAQVTPPPQGIANTKHNLGSGAGPAGRNQVSVADTAEICVFCHTPHAADVSNPLENPPLWNKQLLPAAGYTTYASLNSATIDGEILNVGSTSVACLSCHDGSQAMDNIINAPGSGGLLANGGGVNGRGWTWTGANVTADGLLTGVANLTKDLSNDHPIGIQYCGGFTTPGNVNTCRDSDFFIATSATQTVNGVTRPIFWVDTSGRGGAATTTRDKTDMVLFTRDFADGAGPSVECGSCHDPHADGTAPGSLAGLTFLRVSNNGSQVCLACHNK
jgi:hypothetical protein